jgi:hypothetical protein
LAVRAAAENAASAVIGTDTNAANLAAGLSQAHRRRLDNAMFVVAAAEAIPCQLAGLAGEVRVQYRSSSGTASTACG